MIHIALDYTEITTCLYEEEEDIMVTDIMVDGDRLQNLKKLRIGESVREEGVEYCH